MRVVRIAIDSLALLLAGLLVPGIEIEWSDDAAGILITIVGMALLFGTVNGLLRPAGRVAAVPLKVLTLGTFSFALNAALLLIVAFVLDVVGYPVLHVGSFPPDISLDTVAAAAMGAFVIGAISTTMSVLIPDT